MNTVKRGSGMSRLLNICVYLCCSVVISCLSGGCTQLEGTADFGKRLIEVATGKTAINAATQMENQAFPDERRVGINNLANRSYGLREPYTTRYRQIAETDRDWLVRATAIRALNRSRDLSATPLFVKALSDENDLVRVEACKALVHMPDPNATPGLIRLVADTGQPRDVRIWAADALQHYRTLEVARTLASQLSNREFTLAWQSHRTLVNLTGKDLKYNETAWLQYLSSEQNPFG